MSKKKKTYPNGGDGMFFYHKKTKHPALQVGHSEKTWINRRYIHTPNNIKNYILDNSLPDIDGPMYYHKSLFEDNIYTRGRPYSKINKKKKR